MKKTQIQSLIRCLVSPHTEVAFKTMQLFNNLIKNSPSADLFLQYQLNDQLYICYKVYSKHEDQLKLMKSVLENFDLLLKFDEFKNILIKDKYLKIFRELFNPSNSELAYLCLKILATLAQLLDQQIKLIEMGILQLVVQILASNKEEKLKRQACRFITNISYNPLFTQLLINERVIDMLIVQINSEDRESRILSVIAISNLSGVQNFYKQIQSINVKSLIHIFETGNVT